MKSTRKGDRPHPRIDALSERNALSMASCGQRPQQQGAKIYALLDQQKKPGSAAAAYPQTRRGGDNIPAPPTGWRAHRIMNRCVLVDSERALDAATGQQVTASIEALRQSSCGNPGAVERNTPTANKPARTRRPAPRPTDGERRALDKAAWHTPPQKRRRGRGSSAEAIDPSAGQTVTGRAGR